ncbi:MAG: methyltransferase domain-containing protein [Thermovirgaceae bacterium]|jgi:ubiquinone/menaquinone biosynthesis C-methylase UbiE
MSVFDDHARSYDQWYTTPLGRHVDEVETRCAFDLLKPRKGMKVLDAGCGTGNFSLKMAKLGCDVTGVDLSERMLILAAEKARSEGIRADFLAMDVNALEFTDGTFDAVISMAVLEFVDNPFDAAEEMYRVLKRGGKLVIGTINRLSPWGELYTEIGRKVGSVYHHAKFLGMEEMRQFKPGNLVSLSECLFTRPDTNEEDIRPGEELFPAVPGKGGFLCAMWKK